MVDYANPFAPKPIPLPKFQLPQPAWTGNEPEFVSEGAPTSQVGTNTGQRNFIRTPTPPQGTRGYVAPKGSTSGNGSKTGAITPLTVAAAMKSALGPQAAAEKARAEQLGLTYNAGQGMGTADKTYQANIDTERNTTIDNNLSSVYSPLQQLLKSQQDKATKRYAQNQADITSIFGALSSLTAEDTARVNKQFTDSITKQQTDYATRVAQQNLEAQAGTQQAAATGAERGNGPAMNTNPIQVAAAQGNADANAALTNWQGLMQSEQNQAVKDVETRGTGYTQQRLGALNQLSRNFEDTLAKFESQDATLQSQIAQAKLDQQNAYMSNDAAAAKVAANNLADLQIQELKNKGAMNVATLKARTALAKGSGSSSTNLKGVEAVAAKAKASGVDFAQLQKSVSEATSIAQAMANPAGSKGFKSPDKALIQSTWNRVMQSSPQRGEKQAALANQLIDSMFP
jgi:hypothetical protein